MSNYEILKEYYKKVCTPLVFVGENNVDSRSNVKIYLYDFNKTEELVNFQKVFQEYMLMYVKNYDVIEHHNFDENISKKLRKEFKKIYKIDTPDRATAVNGIFGELFNDYYLKNVINNDTILVYASRIKFNDNYESKGIDVVCCNDKEEYLEIVLSESKFVGTLSHAKNNLIDDISGANNHLNSEYINNYMSFVLDRQQGLDKIQKESVVQKISNLNRKIIAEEKNFIDAINELNYEVKFVYFAIFQYENNRKSNSFLSAVNEIIEEFKKQVAKTGIFYYSVEIVFIPTFNTAMTLKYKMEEIDE